MTRRVVKALALLPCLSALMAVAGCRSDSQLYAIGVHDRAGSERTPNAVAGHCIGRAAGIGVGVQPGTYLVEIRGRARARAAARCLAALPHYLVVGPNRTTGVYRPYG